MRMRSFRLNCAVVHLDGVIVCVCVRGHIHTHLMDMFVLRRAVFPASSVMSVAFIKTNFSF